MALFLFTKAILAGKPIEVFNHGKHARDFTYIDDIVEGVARHRSTASPPRDPAVRATAPDPGAASAPYRVYNIGNHRPVELARYIEVLEAQLGRKRRTRILLPMQPGDVPDTCADVDDLMREVGFRPATPIEDGIRGDLSAGIGSSTRSDLGPMPGHGLANSLATFIGL